MTRALSRRSFDVRNMKNDSDEVSEAAMAERVGVT
jgi:hypothetical protein